MEWRNTNTIIQFSFVLQKFYAFNVNDAIKPTLITFYSTFECSILGLSMVCYFILVFNFWHTCYWFLNVVYEFKHFFLKKKNVFLKTILVKTILN